MSAKSKPKPAKPLASLAREHGVSRETLRAWRDSGLDIQNAEMLRQRIASMPGSKAGDETLLEAKRRRAIADADRAEIAAAREAGDSVPFVAAERAAHVVFVVVRAALRELEGNLPCVLEGRRPEQMAGLLRQAFDELQERMATVDFFPNHPETLAFKKRMAELDEKTLCRRCRKTLETETC
jgi:hypothetical protein